MRSTSASTSSTNASAAANAVISVRRLSATNCVVSDS
jgi:hypothetical protein